MCPGSKPREDVHCQSQGNPAQKNYAFDTILYNLKEIKVHHRIQSPSTLYFFRGSGSRIVESGISNLSSEDGIESIIAYESLTQASFGKECFFGCMRL